MEAGVVNEDKLSAVLSEFARTMITDFPIQRILDRLVERIVEILPVTCAGVTLISAESTPHYIAASDSSARRFERLQSTIRQGPCVEAFESGQPVSVPDLGGDDRFPSFARAGVAAGLAAVFTFPLCHGSSTFGALDLYRDTVGALDAADMAVAQTLADVAAALLLNAKARDEALATSNRFHYHAMHDPLTGLPNRLLLQERLEHAALRARRTHLYTAVLFLDLDRFKQVNDRHGHLLGDELLRSVARRLSTLVRAGDTLARFSGDEFVFLCEELHGVDDVAALVGRINETFSKPFELDGTSVMVHTSVGTAYVGPGDAVTADLLMRADLDMYRAKREGAGVEIVQIHGSRAHPEEDSLERDMRRALDEHLFDIAYHPIVRTDDSSVIGVEALLRWTHPHRGPVPPLLVVSAAERTELICEIGAWVLERACEDHARWMAMRATPPTELDLAVNISVRQLMMPDFCATLSGVLDRTGMQPGRLMLELAESIAVEHSARIMRVLLEVHELGVRLALDDFGTGYSSLSYLSRLPVQIVKIDRRFVAELDQRPARIVVAAVTGMAHELGLTVVAEGVETTAQRDEARAAGCDLAQGFYFARPMPFADVEELVRAQFDRPVTAQHPPLGGSPVVSGGC
ncbi:MAG: GGDEF domain-containing protein [Actinobacteria bacterium]|nr:GGDEF domain-containing protein [Actinomycetota bacterium]